MRNFMIPAAPRAVQGLVRADLPADPKAAIEKVSAAFDDFKERHEQRYANIEASIDDINRKGAAARLGGGGGDLGPVEPEYTKAFASYARRGANDAEAELRTANASGDRAAIQAAMSVGDNSSGGYLAPVEWDRKIQKALLFSSPMRRLAQVQMTSVGSYSTLWSNDQWGSGWVGETASRPATGTAALSALEFASGEIYAMPAVTQRLLDDAAINFEEWIINSGENEFTRQEGIAFIAGNGVNKPRGLLTYIDGGASDNVHPGGNLTVVPSGSATDISPDALVDFKYGLPSPYRQNASWLMNSQTAAIIAKFKDGDGRYIWSESLIEGQPATLLGRPVEIDENMPNIEAGALAIAFGNFNRGYLINDRKGVRVLRDPFTNKPFVMFYMTKRVGGGVLDPNAIRLLKIATE